MEQLLQAAAEQGAANAEAKLAQVSTDGLLNLNPGFDPSLDLERP